MPTSVGLGKLEARTTLNAEFCIPVSMLMVRDTDSFDPRNLETKYPNANPAECKTVTASINFIIETDANEDVADFKNRAFLAEIEPQIKLTNTTAPNGVYFDKVLVTLGVNEFIPNPNMTGINTT